MDIVSAALAEEQAGAELFRARIVVCGVGGGGSNTVQRLSRTGIRGASLIAVNTDAKHLNTLDQSIHRVLIGGGMTSGLGAGGFPEVGTKAAEYSRSSIESALGTPDLTFLAAGMGGGTGTGASPIVAETAKRTGSIVIGVVTFPFRLERVRINTAKRGIEALRKSVDTLIVIDNQRLVELYPNATIDEAFRIADEVTTRAVRGITETINTPSLINLDFSDIRAIMGSGGLAMISVGEAAGPNRVDDVVQKTLTNKLLDVDYEGATGMLIHITGGTDLTLGDANDIGNKLTSMSAPNANVFWGARIDPAYTGRVEVIAIFTGIKSPEVLASDAEPGNRRANTGGLDFV
ncbi:MAG: cell division protein FtsZ [Candidatus Marsarchaeota archaeon]|nr:cell division protein FtsZ [Candidatus Marsarchaeota archaeon]